MAGYDIIIKGGTIVDGTRTPRYPSDVAIKDGRIVQIGGLRGSSATKVLDASGLIVAPGFVDLHTHYDAQIQWDPYCTLSGWHGVTTVLIGNCGFGFAPCRVEDRERAMMTLTRNEAIPYDAMKAGMLWDWVTFPEFLDSIDRIPKGINVFTVVGLAPLFVWVMGEEQAKSRRPTEAELREMCRLVEEGMDAGAIGWSAQVQGEKSAQRDYDGTPMITDLMTNEEILTFAQVLGDRGGGYIELSYDPGDEGFYHRGKYQTQELYEKVAEASRGPVVYQSIRGDVRDPEGFRQTIRWFADCTKRGLRVIGQGQLHRGGDEFSLADWNLFDQSPAWRAATIGTPEERKRKIQDPQIRAAMKTEWDSGIEPGSNPGSLTTIMIEEVGRPEFAHYEGQTVGEVAEKEGKHVVDAMLDLAAADDLKTLFYVDQSVSNPHYSAEVIKTPEVVAGLSDGGAHVKFRVIGSYPTDMLTWLVRDEGLVSLEDAHHKLSHLPAVSGGLKGRGLIREGAWADIVVYDLQGLKNLPPERVYDLPGGEWRRIQKAEGYRWTLVNGQVTFEDGEPTGGFPGKLLRHGGD